jgi:hypothetical protein
MLSDMTTSDMYHWWRNFAVKHRYDYPTHLKICEMVEAMGRLPASMMLFAPTSDNPDVWTDILRIKTLNTDLSRKTSESHVCPLQLDVVERLIERYSNPGDVIFDPFAGLHTVPYVALKMKRKGWGVELNPTYWKYGAAFCERMEKEMQTPTLFDLVDYERTEIVDEDVAESVEA